MYIMILVELIMVNVTLDSLSFPIRWFAVLKKKKIAAELEELCASERI